MAVRQDIALSDNDLYVKDGDFAIAESDEQHIQDTINAFPGWWKEFPSEGVGVFQFVNASGAEQALSRSIQLQLKADGYTSTPKVTNDNGKLTIEANANF